ncbi:MAG: fasciclin domain-containing protein [Deltaproteobacteria bacterium]|nr:fasciclin domain-containing protein [Deltaproteobacteria bacterium]
MARFARVLGFSVAFLGLVACGGETPGVADPTTAASIGKADIVATAEGAGSFKTLLAAVKAADLEATLHGEGPFTVFAPTDEAFKKLPPGTVESLLKPENKEKLKAILTYHVVAGKVPAAEALKLTTAKTVNGKELKLAASGSNLKVGSANVVKADVMASNGVIHVIDTVILPE